MPLPAPKRNQGSKSWSVAPSARNSSQNMPESGGTANSSQKNRKKKQKSALLIAIFWSPSRSLAPSGPSLGVWRSHDPMIPASGSWPQYRNKLKRKHSWHPMDHRKTTSPRGTNGGEAPRCAWASLVESSTWPAAFSSLEAGGLLSLRHKIALKFWYAGYYI